MYAQRQSWFHRLNWTALLLVCVVIVLGAFVRLSDAGLGCPDWPGCYGQIGVPLTEQAVAEANAAYPERPVEAPKAWKEMIHRYAASLLGLLILIMAIIACRHRADIKQPLFLPLFLLILVIFQGLLGMWTVTELLQPMIVTSHLLGGMTTLGLLLWLLLRHGRYARVLGGADLQRLALFALLALIAQIALGAWTSTNYAATACPDFPQCQGQWWPKSDFAEAFVLWRELGVDYEGGVLSSAARTAIHLVHRLGAIVATLIIGWLGIRLFLKSQRALRWAGVGVLSALIVQLTIAIGMIQMQFPLPMATAHNAGAALLLIAVIFANHVTKVSKA